MIYLFVPLIALVVTHILKFAVFVWRKRNFVGNRVWWSFFWLGSFPSVHSATLTSILYLIWWSQGFTALFGFALIVSIILIYGLLEDNKRQVLYEHYFSSSKNEALVKISQDGILMDFSGHTLLEMVSGGIIGVLVAITALHF